MVQRGISQRDIQENLLLLEHDDDDFHFEEEKPTLSDSAKKVQQLQATSVKICKSNRSVGTIIWKSGDVPEFDTDLEVKVGIPEIKSQSQANFMSSTTETERTRIPGFGGDEYCRLLHVFGDSRTNIPRQRIANVYNSAELDAQIEDPWDAMTLLFQRHRV